MHLHCFEPNLHEVVRGMLGYDPEILLIIVELAGQDKSQNKRLTGGYHRHLRSSPGA